jgi:alkylation response protein AidB-like acyl-CoA dehydrogenase
MALIPVADLDVELTWDVVGMRGTASHTLVAADIVVPAHRVRAFTLPAAQTLLRTTLTILGPVVGAAQGALGLACVMFAGGRKPSGSSYTKISESPAARQWLAEATHLADRGLATTLEVARSIDLAGEKDPLSPKDAARLRMEVVSAVRDCRDAVELMLDLYGSSGFDAGNPIQRFWRDLAVGSRHPQLNPYLTVEDYGRALTDALG